MFKRLPEEIATPRAVVPVTIDGVIVDARDGDSVAAVLLSTGKLAFRATAVSGAPRGPFCMMGVCFDCLVTVDGKPNQQACHIRVAAGMKVET